MSDRSLPHALQSAIKDMLDADQGALWEGATALRSAYGRGHDSSDVPLSAYLAVRMPATYAAISRVLDLVADVAPDFAPKSILDIGAGPGTASWAAVDHWASLAQVIMVERDARFAELAQSLAQASEDEVLRSAPVERLDMGQVDKQAELVVAAYVFAEQQEDRAKQLALKLWEASTGFLIIIEPGTPEGFARVRAARAALLEAGAHMVAPCPHAGDCPMAGADWCHFKTRLQRSKVHMQAKDAHVPFEDESFSFVAVSRPAVFLPPARIIGPVKSNKVGATLRLCGHGGVEELVIASRDRAAYKFAKKSNWGDSWG